MKAEIKLSKAILHILDANVSMPVLSTQELELTEETEAFLTRHIQKIFDDGNIQDSVFFPDSRMFGIIDGFVGGTSGFIETSRNIATFLFEILIKNIEIPSADLAVCLFSCEGREYLGILKLNYKTGYSHYVSNVEGGVSNAIITQKTLMPLENQKITECAVVSIRDMKVKVLQKDYEINGSKEEYWSKIFLQCHSELSNNSKLNILDRTTQKIAKKYFEEDFSKVAKARSVLAESLEEASSVRIDELAHEVFESNEEIKREYKEELHKAGIRENSVSISNELVGRKVRNQKIRTDTGIEINFPSHYFNDKDKIEFINNVDGTVSIVIKNIGKIQNR